MQDFLVFFKTKDLIFANFATKTTPNLVFLAYI